LLQVQSFVGVRDQFFDAPDREDDDVAFVYRFFYHPFGGWDETQRPCNPSEHWDVKQNWGHREHCVFRTEMVHNHAAAQYSVRVAAKYSRRLVRRSDRRPTFEPGRQRHGREEISPPAADYDTVTVLYLNVNRYASAQRQHTCPEGHPENRRHQQNGDAENPNKHPAERDDECCRDYHICCPV
jgi:hypothetical protein